MFTLASLVVATALSAAPVPEIAPLPSSESTLIAELQLAPGALAAAAIPPPQGNCQVTCWSTGVTYSTGASSMNQCGQFGDLKCGVCNWDGLYNWRPFANC